MDNKAQTFAKWLIMLLFAVPATLRAQTFGGGSGTVTDPYIISTTDHFDQLAADVNNGNKYENVYFKLMADLDYTNKTFTSVGGAYYREYNSNTQTWFYGYRAFSGCFLGNNHSINNVTINTDEEGYYGLFGYLGYGGDIGNLSLGGQSSMTTTGNTGGIVGSIYSSARVINCHVGEHVVISVHPTSSSYDYRPTGFGGVVGSSSGIIEKCTSKATISNNGITKTTEMGGIVGGMGDGSIYSCYFMGTVVGTNKVGDIVGDKTGGKIEHNYYHTSTRHGGVNGTDTDGAQWMGTVTFGEYVSGSVLSATYWDGSTPYFAVGKAMVMSNMNYNTPAGYVAEGLTYSANGVALVEDGSYYRFTMPDEDVTITGNATVKRDIGYSDWVTINIPSQIYSGHALTPVITITDNMTGTPVTLVEGTDYSVTLPDGDCINYGDYPITITGIGTFGGQTTAVFSIVYSGSGTEEEPYLILTTDDMDGLAAIVNGGDGMSGKHFRLMNNLDYSGKTYTPIGILEPNCRFDGIFDGYGHSINNVVIDQPDKNYQALFGTIDDNGIVMNLVLGAGSSIKGGNYVGGIAGLCGGTITGCTVSEGVSISGNKEVGGIAGRIVGTLSGCVNNASVSGYNLVGGIAGSCYESIINNNLNLGEIIRTAPPFIAFTGGGIAGIIDNSTLQNNYYAGACETSGISHKDAKGQAMKGWIISNDENVFAQMFPIDDVEGTFVGITYDGIRYLGAGETTKLIIDRTDGAPAGDFTVTAGTLTPLDEEFYGRTDMFYLLTMPEPGQNVNISINTATAIDHIPQTSENADGQWYTIDGQRLQGKPTKKGIYIHNGKKVIK